MALYLGNSKPLTVYFNGTACSLKLFTANTDINRTLLTSSNNYILKDSNGLYLIPKEDS